MPRRMKAAYLTDDQVVTLARDAAELRASIRAGPSTIRPAPAETGPTARPAIRGRVTARAAAWAGSFNSGSPSSRTGTPAGSGSRAAGAGGAAGAYTPAARPCPRCGGTVVRWPA